MSRGFSEGMPELFCKSFEENKPFSLGAEKKCRKSFLEA